MAEREAEVPEAERIRFRIGINLGDVIREEDGDLYGDGVNVAARLEQAGRAGRDRGLGHRLRPPPGQARLRLRLPGRAAAQEHRAAGAGLPGRARRRHRRHPRRPAPSLPDKPAVAVLPFDNLSGDPEQAYFSDGITEDIITELARFRELLVIARNSSFAFRGKAVDVREIGRALGAGYVVEGSVRRAGDRVRITAQLIDAATGAHLWAERYDRPLEDVFAIQDEIARGIVATVAARVLEESEIAARRRPPRDVRAYDLFLQGYRLSDTDTPEAQDAGPGVVRARPRARPDLRPRLHGPGLQPLHARQRMPASGCRAARTPTGGRRCGWPSRRWRSTPTTRGPTTRWATCA